MFVLVGENNGGKKTGSTMKTKLPPHFYYEMVC